MTDALEDHEGTVSIGGSLITNFRFADDIDGLEGDEEELANLVERLDKAFTAYGIEISAEKNKLMTNNTSGINIASIMLATARLNRIWRCNTISFESSNCTNLLSSDNPLWL